VILGGFSAQETGKGVTMRLTLRTLLAYLDDRLPPANAREIGQKINNSPFTTDLVERIRDVKRRRRLADPGKAQPMIEPNLIAEYLDDQLTPDLVARVEREILASDAMLAEVAATHEILGLLRDPVTVEPRLRDRLYGLDPSGKTSLVRALNAESSPSTAAAATASTWKPLTVQKTSSKRIPVIVAGVLGLVWLAVLVSDSTSVRAEEVSTSGSGRRRCGRCKSSRRRSRKCR
jgi:anti-sigma factor RsiW